MDTIRCVRSLIDLQTQLQRAIALQEEIQAEILAHFLNPQSCSRRTMPKGLEANEDVEAYFTVFERAATTLNLPQKKWGPQLMKLFGMDLRDAPLQDLGYDIVKDNLRCQASEAERQWQVNFTMASFDSMKGPRELGQELVEAAMHWLKPERRSAAEVVQLVALHQFLTLLPGTVSDWVAQHQPKDMEEGIGLAEHFLGNRHNEEYGGSDKKVVAWQYSTTCSTDEPSSSLAYDQITPVDGQEGKEQMPLTAEPKQEEITLKVCQSASFNVEAQGLGEVYLEEEEEDTPNTEHAPVEEEEEEDDLCHAEVVTESLSSTGQLPTTTAGMQAVRRSPSKGVSVVSGVNKAMPQTKSHMCSDCGKGFTRLFHLRRHKCGSSAFSCHKCGATFASRPQLAQHRRSHSKPHGCPYCEKRFRDTFNLRLHVRTHTGERPYQCSDCGDTFAQKRGLLEHLNTHTGQRPFVCHECGKAFCHSRTLSKHCQLHSDMRPFLCTLCGKTFKIKDSLKRHQLIHDKVST